MLLCKHFAVVFTKSVFRNYNSKSITRREMTRSAYETNARRTLFFTGFKRNQKGISGKCVEKLCHFQRWKNWPGKKHRGVLECRTRCDVLARRVKAVAAWSDRAVYHAVLWWWILDWFTWLVLASRRLKGLYDTQTHKRARMWTGTRAESSICLHRKNLCFVLNCSFFGTWT